MIFPRNLDTSWALVAQMIAASESENARGHRSDPQHWFIRGIRKIGVPVFFELGTKLGQFRWLRAPFDARVDSADAMVSQEMGKK